MMFMDKASFFKTIRLLFFLSIGTIFFVNINFNNIDILSYFIFSFLSFLLLDGIFKNHCFSDIILRLFFFLGFWFKFSISILIDLPFGDFGNFKLGSYEISTVTETLRVSSLFLFSYLIASFFLSRFNFKIKILFFDKVYSQINKNIKYLLIFFVITVVFFIVGNLKTFSYVRGLEPIYNFTFTNLIFKIWFVFISLFCIGFFIDSILIYKKQKYSLFFIFLLLVLLFLNYTFILSRYLPLLNLIVLYSIYQHYNYLNFKIDKKFLNVLIIIFFLNFLSILLIFFLRLYFFIPYVVDNSAMYNNIISIQKPNDLNTYKNLILSLFIQRWVGIESLMVIISKQSFGWELFKNFDSTQFNLITQDPNFYKNKFIKIPGPAAYFFIPGSYLFEFIISFIFFSIVFSIDKIFFHNLGFCAKNLCLFSICEKFVHSGFNFYNFLAFLIFIIIFFLFFYFIKNILLTKNDIN